MTTSRSLGLPPGTELRALTTHPDRRGELTEIFRNEWHESPLPVQWLVAQSGVNVLRGVHAHARHWDYLCAVGGSVFVGLHDLRPDEPAARRAATLKLDSELLQMLVIPPGVAHGFYSPGPSLVLLGASEYHDPSDHLRCRWDSPELGLEWPCREPDLSASDRQAGAYAELRAALRAAVPAG